MRLLMLGKDKRRFEHPLMSYKLDFYEDAYKE